MAKDTEWITVAEASKLTGYNAQHVRKLLREGQIKGRKFGPVWMIDRASLLGYAARAQAAGGKSGPKR